VATPERCRPPREDLGGLGRFTRPLLHGPPESAHYSRDRTGLGRGGIGPAAPPGDHPAQQVLASHIRSLLPADHLYDVQVVQLAGDVSIWSWVARTDSSKGVQNTPFQGVPSQTEALLAGTSSSPGSRVNWISRPRRRTSPPWTSHWSVGGFGGFQAGGFGGALGGSFPGGLGGGFPAAASASGARLQLQPRLRPVNAGRAPLCCGAHRGGCQAARALRVVTSTASSNPRGHPGAWPMRQRASPARGLTLTAVVL
jgi:hypothetical protein